MENLFKFLNETNGERLFWIGFFIVVVLGILVDGVVKMYKHKHRI